MRLAWVILVPVLWAGCAGVVQTAPENPRGTSDLKPTRPDKDAGRVGVAAGFDPTRYRVLAVERFAVTAPRMEGDEERKVARAMPEFFQAEIVRRLAEARLFDHVLNLSETGPPRRGGALRLEGEITHLTPGSRVFRYIGLGAGRSTAQAETRFVDIDSGRVVLVTADRRVASRVRRDGEAHMRESFAEMAHDLERFLVRLARGEPPRR